jgi:NAD(P)-dependent dehydrogenase (short-subunit alcohol dehydrogenase family)
MDLKLKGKRALVTGSTAGMASPDEVANLVANLCGEGASATTDAALRVDGGVVRTIA